MAGPFDNFFSGGGAAAGNMFGGNMYGDLLTPEQLAAVRRQSMMQVAAKLLESSGPSTTRRTLGQTLGGALSAGAEAMQTGQTNAVQQMLLRQKLEEGKMEREQNERIRKMIGGGDATIDTINAPTETAGRVGPTVQRAAMPTTAVNPLMAGLTDQQRAILQVTPTSKVPDVLAGFQKDASAMSEVTGQPFEVTDATGRPILVQQTKGGKLTTLEGFGPKREIVLENMGGRTVAIDKKSLKGGETFQRDMTPGEVASNRVALGNLGVAQGNLSLAQQRFALDAESGGSGRKPTEGQMGASGFATRMEAAEDIFSKIPAAQVPRFGMSGQSSIMSYFRSPEGQMAKQAADDWIRSKLRKESGAVIGEEEMEAEYKTYFPMPGDSAQVVAQKAQARQRATDAMKRNAGPAYVPYTPPPAAAPIQGLGTGTMDLGNYFNSPR
jgi:hypothetical protein